MGNSAYQKGTGTFVAVLADVVACLAVLSQFVTGRRGNGFLLLQIEIFSSGEFECLDL
jgi:hypothetical protein